MCMLHVHVHVLTTMAMLTMALLTMALRVPWPCLLWLYLLWLYLLWLYLLWQAPEVRRVPLERLVLTIKVSSYSWWSVVK